MLLVVRKASVAECSVIVDSSIAPRDVQWLFWYTRAVMYEHAHFEDCQDEAQQRLVVLQVTHLIGRALFARELCNAAHPIQPCEHHRCMQMVLVCQVECVACCE
jgi:hypothetical protein